jgi:hypothetical protein
MRHLTTAVVALALCGAVQGCRSGSPFDEDMTTNTKVHLVVKNESINQMDVYAVADGLATRVGTVGGLATQGFALDQSFYQASDFRIVGTPFGGNGRASTGPIQVSRGQTVFFTIRNTLRASTVSIQNP